MRIQNNIKSINSNRNYNKNARAIEKSLQKLSSGYDINTAADNAAGIAISEKMRAQIFGLEKALENIEQGRSVAQTADGALQEVNDMLVRARTLTIAAKNSTYSDQELDAVNDELSHITSEIDRIAKSTNINGVYPLTRTVYKSGTMVDFKDVELKADLTNPPLTSSGQYNIGARTAASSSVQDNWNLVYGSGSTSYEQIRIKMPKYDDSGALTGDTEIVNVSLNSSGTQFSDSVSMTFKGRSYDSATDTWSLNYSYNKLISGIEGDPAAKYIEITIAQNVKLNAKAKSDPAKAENDIQYYDISYIVKNTSTADGADEIEFDFMHHFDTAYNNNDAVERYYVGGNRVEKSTMYDSSNIPDSFSIWGPVSELPFTGSVVVDAANKPDYLYLGHYSLNTPYWKNFDDPATADKLPLYPGTDLGFSMAWKGQKINKSDTDGNIYSFKFGIQSTETDSNIDGSEAEAIDKFPGVWIQSGSEVNDGFFMHTCDTTASALMLDPPPLNVSSVILSDDSLKRIDKAIEKVVSFRGNFGADMNRLDYAQNVDKILQENMTASESRIRDLDMAKEIASFTKSNILLQASQAMSAQANMQPQYILNLLK